MADRQRTIEVFTAGCSCCDEWVARVQGLACPSCAVQVLDMMDPAVSRRAKSLGVRTVPAIAIDGVLASCCGSGGPDEDVLRRSGLGQPLA